MLILSHVIWSNLAGFAKTNIASAGVFDPLFVMREEGVPY